jgi:hypothetical protein
MNEARKRTLVQRESLRKSSVISEAANGTIKCQTCPCIIPEGEGQYCCKRCVRHKRIFEINWPDRCKEMLTQKKSNQIDYGALGEDWDNNEIFENMLSKKPVPKKKPVKRAATSEDNNKPSDFGTVNDHEYPKPADDMAVDSLDMEIVENAGTNIDAHQIGKASVMSENRMSSDDDFVDSRPKIGSELRKSVPVVQNFAPATESTASEVSIDKENENTDPKLAWNTKGNSAIPVIIVPHKQYDETMPKPANVREVVTKSLTSLN